MQFRTAVRSVSATAIAGGLTLGLGVSTPATAMPVHDRAESLGRLCHAAAQARPTERGVAPSSIEGLPGLRCGQAFGQAFGRAALAGDDTDETVSDDEAAYADATEAEDSGASDEALETDAADDSYQEQSDDADEPEESDDAYESDEPAEESDSAESEDSEDSAEQEDSEESHEQEDADYDDEGDDGDDGTEHSEHHDD